MAWPLRESANEYVNGSPEVTSLQLPDIADDRDAGETAPEDSLAELVLLAHEDRLTASHLGGNFESTYSREQSPIAKRHAGSLPESRCESY